jgi:TRAP-type C4-dicarboxylate transport system substrate-binding protein
MLQRRALMASLLTLTALPARATEQWRIITEYPATAMPGEGIAVFAAGATDLSNGTLTVTPGFDAPDGIRSAAMLDAVAQGRVMAADAFTGALADVAPIFQISALPFLTGSASDTGKLLAAARPAYQKALAARGLTLLYATPWPATGLWSRHPLSGPDALQGLRVRTYDATSTAVMQAAGAAPVQISFADAVPRLKSGALDAVMSSGDGGAGAKLWEILPNFTVLDYASPLSLAFCNSAALAALPDLARKAVIQAASDTEIRQFTAITNRIGDNVTRMQANGVKIAEVPSVRAALTKAAAPVLQAWVARAGADGAAIIAAYHAAQ